jgi:hypothetical protein
MGAICFSSSAYCSSEQLAATSAGDYLHRLHLVLNIPLDECIDNTQREMKFKESKKKEKQGSSTHDQNQRKVTSRAKHKLHTENSKKAPPEQMQAPPEHVDAKIQN